MSQLLAEKQAANQMQSYIGNKRERNALMLTTR